MLFENYQSPAKTVTPQWCKVYPGGQPGSGNDFAVCKLSSPVSDVGAVVVLRLHEVAPGIGL